MSIRLGVLACQAAAFGALAVGAGSPTSYVLRAGPGYRLQLGSWRVDRKPTYAAAIAAYGKASECRPALGSAALVVWRSAGFRLFVTTLGGLPKGATYCTAPAAVYVDWLIVDGKRWRTLRGLRVGDPVARIRSLYPSATRHRTVWWLVTRRAACIGVCPGKSLFVTAPMLVATTRAGRVLDFRSHLGAQGE
jgi:hypothetical protein